MKRPKEKAKTTLVSYFEKSLEFFNKITLLGYTMWQSVHDGDHPEV